MKNTIITIKHNYQVSKNTCYFLNTLIFPLTIFFLFIIMDLEDDCIEALHTGSITEMCVKTAKLKWNLLQLSSVTTESKNIESSCCAMYDALNCLQKSSCNTCPQEDLHGKKVFCVWFLKINFIFQQIPQTQPGTEFVLFRR